MMDDKRLGWEWDPFDFENGKILSRDEGFHQVLCKMLGSQNVYYQPPESLKMKYPCIVYSREKIDNGYANNRVYTQNNAFKVIVIDEDPDSEIVWRISRLPSSRFERHYVSENLNHDVFLIYY